MSRGGLMLSRKARTVFETPWRSRVGMIPPYPRSFGPSILEPEAPTRSKPPIVAHRFNLNFDFLPDELGQYLSKPRRNEQDRLTKAIQLPPQGDATENSLHSSANRARNF